jgi:hypothetical protein
MFNFSGRLNELLYPICWSAQFADLIEFTKLQLHPNCCPTKSLSVSQRFPNASLSSSLSFALGCSKGFGVVIVVVIFSTVTVVVFVLNVVVELFISVVDEVVVGVIVVSFKLFDCGDGELDDDCEMT